MQAFGAGVVSVSVVSVSAVSVSVVGVGVVSVSVASVSVVISVSVSVSVVSVSVASVSVVSVSAIRVSVVAQKHKFSLCVVSFLRNNMCFPGVLEAFWAETLVFLRCWKLFAQKPRFPRSFVNFLRRTTSFL